MYISSFSLSFFSLLFATTILAADYVSPNIELGDKFNRKGSKTFVKVGHVFEDAEMGVAKYSFHVYAHDNVVEKLGFVCVTYCHKENPQCSNANVLEISLMEIDEKFRRRGYGEEALRTVLGVFRAAKRKDLSFTSFQLTVGMGENRKAARSLYTKVGFHISRTMAEISYYDMTLAR